MLLYEDEKVIVRSEASGLVSVKNKKGLEVTIVAHFDGLEVRWDDQVEGDDAGIMLYPSKKEVINK